MVEGVDFGEEGLDDLETFADSLLEHEHGLGVAGVTLSVGRPHSIIKYILWKII